MSERPSTLRITEPGVYYDLDERDYHRQHDWISWSSLKHLLPPNTPAHFRHYMDSPRVEKRHFDLGKVVHALVLGAGAEFEIVHSLDKQKQPKPAESYTPVSAQADRDRIYGEGKTPILEHELTAAKAMAEQVKAHPSAGVLLADGKPEVSLFWVDEETGVKCRARLDWLPNAVEGRRLIVPDLKTSATPVGAEEFAKSAAKFGYFGQQDFYRRGIRACDLDPSPAFLFVAVETAPPHLVSVPQIANRDDLHLAHAAVDRCIRLYAECSTTNNWPGHSAGVTDLSLPNWLHYQLEAFTA